jgi:wyosine [tRNA(Phe)-imidazoG37] synthetase (radical SAM superfamily)
VASPIVYGPVPSRRLGRSLGINNIPPKKCSYSCVYCQLGRSTDMRIEREIYHDPLEITRRVEERVKRTRENGETIDYITFVADGEPTLDINLGTEIELLRALAIKIAVITNASLIWREDIKRDLQKADWVSLKVDSTTPGVWSRINRPHGGLKLDVILEGMTSFARTFQGILATETMLIKGINDDTGGIGQVADFLKKIEPDIAYLAIPTRPPAERLEPATESTVNAAYQIFTDRLSNVEYLIGYEGNAFTTTGSAVDDLLSITAVHPMREVAVIEILNKARAGWDIITGLIEGGKLAETEYQGNKFYVRKLPRYSRRVPG